MLSLDSARAVALLLPPDGRRHVLEALRDPSSRDAVIGLLQSSDPPAALARQAERDVAEAVTPMGRPIVFKSVARSLAPRLIRVADALVNALPYKDTQSGNAALAISLAAEDPEAEFLELYQEVALDAFGHGGTPALSGDEWLAEYYGHDPQMAGLLKSLKKVGKTLKKVAKKIPWRPIALVASVVVGTAATVLTGGAAAPIAFMGVKTLAGAIGGQTSGVVQKMFGVASQVSAIGAQVASAVTAGGGGGFSAGGSSSGLATAFSALTKVAQVVTQPKAPPVKVQPYVGPTVTPQAWPSSTVSSGGGTTTPVYTAATTPMTAEEVQKAAKETIAAQGVQVPPWAWVAGGVAAFGVLAYVMNDRGAGRRARR